MSFVGRTRSTLLWPRSRASSRWRERSSRKANRKKASSSSRWLVSPPCPFPRRWREGDSSPMTSEERGHDRGGRDARGDDEGLRFETRAIHAGQDPEPQYGAVNVPIFQTSTYAQPGVGKPRKYDYARGGNPTREALQAVLASLEGGTAAFSFSSGMAAETTLPMLLRPGGHVVLGDDVYGGTYRLLAKA